MRGPTNSKEYLKQHINFKNNWMTNPGLEVSIGSAFGLLRTSAVIHIIRIEPQWNGYWIKGYYVTYLSMKIDWNSVVDEK